MTAVSTRWTAGLALLAALGMLVVCSCGDDDCVCPKDDAPARDTPEHLLASYCDVLEGRSIDDYYWLLNGDYRFFFIEEDWDSAGVTQDAPYWEKWRDVTSTTHMFGDSHVLSIECDLIPVGDITVTDTVATCTHAMDLRVIYQREGDEPIMYWVNRSLLHFVLCRNRNDPGLWAIRGITEEIETSSLASHSLAGRAVEATSFGTIKAMFK